MSVGGSDNLVYVGRWLRERGSGRMADDEGKMRRTEPTGRRNKYAGLQ